MSSVMIVDAQRLGEAPQSFRDYVAEYFHKGTMMGRRIFWSGRTTSMPYRPYPRSSYKDAAWRGTAPSHSVDLQRFAGLSEWLRDNKEAGIFYEFIGPQEFRNPSFDDD